MRKKGNNLLLHKPVPREESARVLCYKGSIRNYYQQKDQHEAPRWVTLCNLPEKT